MSKVLLIANNSFSDSSNNGKTYEAIFSEFNKSDIAQLFFSQNENPDFKYCNNYFKITDKDVLFNFFSKVKRGEKLKNVKQLNQRNENIIEHKKSKIFSFFQKKAGYLVLLRDFIWSFNTWKTKKLKNWINDFNPDIIFFVGGDMEFPHIIAKWVSQEYKIPLVIYFTDDYVIFPVNRNFLDKLKKKRANKFYIDTVKRSSLRFVIGDLMAKEYKNYFNCEFNSIMNSIELTDFEEYIGGNDKLVISYFGGLHLNRWKMICRLGKLLSDNYTINVYTIDTPSAEIINEFEISKVNYCGAVRGNALRNKILESDILLHVESDDEYYMNLTRLSVSTKIPEYLISGRAILGFGPPELASMKILSDNNIGFVISSSDKNTEILNKIDIIYDFNFRKNMGINAYNYAHKYFNRKDIATKFKQRIENL
ncbi:hypothetical protein BAS10_08555 [Elizabethkingia meningoseptica]|uniref:hypothetical protein n=1 Tax=Elizabethkingia meningoseptica TaxID=238 RepID=UPI00099AB955|nr:hypothetical protein [Elizabethkingia meningoseptica]OPB97077.1 hypothetical protein BAS10_08555 [Elizabethkingia meningoseptica]